MLYSKHATMVKTCFDDVGNRLLVDVYHKAWGKPLTASVLIERKSLYDTANR